MIKVEKPSLGKSALLCATCWQETAESRLHWLLANLVHQVQHSGVLEDVLLRESHCPLLPHDNDVTGPSAGSAWSLYSDCHSSWIVSCKQRGRAVPGDQLRGGLLETRGGTATHVGSQTVPSSYCCPAICWRKCSVVLSFIQKEFVTFEPRPSVSLSMRSNCPYSYESPQSTAVVPPA